jgi:hypothetical protein
MTDAQMAAFLRGVFGADPWPKPLNLIAVKEYLAATGTVQAAARALGTTAARVQTIANSRTPTAAVLGMRYKDIPADQAARIRKILGVLILGRAAEIAFEDIYTSAMGTSEFELVDLREGHSDTDYRLLNGGKRALYRINIKFFGSNFRRGPELVGLQPEDCFPLATYKIHGALQKQEDEHLPYVFVIVGVPGLTGDAIAPIIEDHYVQPLAWLTASSISGKRALEDRVVGRIVEANLPAFRQAYDRIRSADWFVLSARRADALLREKLFSRVYALRIRGFAQQFRGAELDMHFSLSQDMMSLPDFLDLLKKEGQTRAASMLERGSI